jgi:hypothetical protein
MTVHAGLRRRLVSSLSTTALIAGVAFTTVTVAPAANAAPSATTGLYGAADPTYDGVYRQSLAVMGLTSAGVRPADAAVSWLVSQQCPSGAFQAYRADLSKPCDAVDAVNFTGPDTNSTAMAVMGLMSVLNLSDSKALTGSIRSSVVKAAAKAVTWLGDQQNTDGGWPWTTGGPSDANSTGLSLSALLTQAANEPFPAFTKGSKYLGRLSFSCTAGGGLAFQNGGAVNASATAQGLVGLAGPMPVTGPRKLAVAVPCANNAKAKSASYLAEALAANGTLSSPYGTDADYANTSAAVLGLVGAHRGRAAVARATAALKANALAFTTHSGSADAGALGLLLMVSEATGASPTAFGGVNLVTTLTGSIRK